MLGRGLGGLVLALEEGGEGMAGDVVQDGPEQGVGTLELMDVDCGGAAEEVLGRGVTVLVS